jgi:cytidylate kinase
MTSYRYIAIEGLIGAGKTPLAKRLATEWNATLVLEGFAVNAFSLISIRIRSGTPSRWNCPSWPSGITS